MAWWYLVSSGYRLHIHVPRKPALKLLVSYCHSCMSVCMLATARWQKVCSASIHPSSGIHPCEWLATEAGKSAVERPVAAIATHSPPSPNNWLIIHHPSPAVTRSRSLAFSLMLILGNAPSQHVKNLIIHIFGCNIRNALLHYVAKLCLLVYLLPLLQEMNPRERRCIAVNAEQWQTSRAEIRASKPNEYAKAASPNFCIDSCFAFSHLVIAKVVSLMSRDIHPRSGETFNPSWLGGLRSRSRLGMLKIARESISRMESYVLYSVRQTESEGYGTVERW
ncbi:hypothetical protein BKA64DRAFT_469420 [Cadophora sp. MPI-SDFR-AT-0126]|nr:hypothetical protein BKA64DRAFT_469420 [Leotiomycetes sp. MPI-SDFR-AT-0126]